MRNKEIIRKLQITDSFSCHGTVGSRMPELEPGGGGGGGCKLVVKIPHVNLENANKDRQLSVDVFASDC